VEQRLGLGVVALVLVEGGQVVEAAGSGRMSGPNCSSLMARARWNNGSAWA